MKIVGSGVALNLKNLSIFDQDMAISMLGTVFQNLHFKKGRKEGGGIQRPSQ